MLNDVDSVIRDLCDCGPDVCLNDPRYPPKVAKKKADLKTPGSTDDLIALLDRDGKCVMAIDQAPDGFRILLVKANGDNNSIPWTKQDEEPRQKGNPQWDYQGILQAQREEGVGLL